MSDFHHDDAWQKGVRDRILAPWYRYHATGGRYVFLDRGRFSEMMQKGGGGDTIIELGGAALTVEEKIVRAPKKLRSFPDYFLETESCTLEGLESPGWMRYSQADLLLYCFLQHNNQQLEVHVIKMPELRAWFEELEHQWPIHTMPGNNRTRGRLVPIRDVKVAGLRKRCLMVPESGK